MREAQVERVTGAELLAHNGIPRDHATHRLDQLRAFTFEARDYGGRFVMTYATLRVLDVYGNVHVVSRQHFEAGKVQIPLFTKSGMRLSEYHALMNWHGKPTTIHRENIAKVQP